MSAGIITTCVKVKMYTRYDSGVERVIKFLFCEILDMRNQLSNSRVALAFVSHRVCRVWGVGCGVRTLGGSFGSTTRLARPLSFLFITLRSWANLANDGRIFYSAFHRRLCARPDYAFRLPAPWPIGATTHWRHRPAHIGATAQRKLAPRGASFAAWRRL